MQQQRRAGVGRHAPGLLQAAQQPAGEVGHAARAERRDRVLERRLVSDGPGRDDDVGRVVERHDTEAVARIEPVNERQQRGARGFQPLTAHRAAAVEHDLHGGRRPRPVLRRLGGAQLEHDRQLVGLLDGDKLDIDMGVQAHRVLLVVAGIEDGSSPLGEL